MANLYVDSYRLNETSSWSNGRQVNDANDRVAQNFVASSAYTAYGVSLVVSRVNTPGTVTVGLYAVDGNDKPTGAALASGTFDGDIVGVGTTKTWVDVTFGTPYLLTSSTEYTIVMSANPAPDAINWWYDYTANPVQEQMWNSIDGGSSWTEEGGAGGGDAAGFGMFTRVINPSDKRYTRNIVTFCNNKVFYGPDPDNLTELAAADGDIDCTKPLSACEAFGKVFVANHDKFRVADFTNVKITTGDILGGALPYHGDIVTGGDSSAQMVVDFITTSSSACTVYGNRITTATFTDTETVTGTNKNGDAISFVLNADEAAGPFWYTWTPYGNDTTAFGEMPAFSGVIELHIGRVWLTGDTRYPHQWYATRQNNPWDFLYAQNDAGSAVAGNNTDAGEVGDMVLDVISYSDDYAVFGCASELHVLLGNPCAGGRINLMRNSGLLAPRAWTWDDDGNLYMLSTEGILVVPKGFGPADNLTKANYPDFVEDLAYNADTDRISFAYDRRNKGIFVTKIVVSTGVSQSWFVDLRSSGFFPESYPEECAAFSTWNYDADDPSDSYLLVGCTDGYVRRWDKTTKSDDAGASGNEAIDAYIGFGPIATSDKVRRSHRVSGIDIASGGDGDGGTGNSNNLYCKVYINANAQKVISDMTSGASPRYTKTHKSPGQRKGNVDRRKVFGRWAGLAIGNNTAAQSFSLEHLHVNGI